MDIKRIEKNIAVVCYPGKSGLNHYSFSLCRELAPLCERLYFITNKDSEFDDSELVCNIVKLFSRTRWIWMKYIQFICFILFWRIEIIHFQSYIKYPFIDYLIFLLLKFAGKKLVLTSHDVFPIYSKWYHFLIFRYIYRLFNVVIVHSEHNKKLLITLAGDSIDVHVIPHGLYDIFLPKDLLSQHDARKQLGIYNQCKVILFFGNINERKGAMQIIKEMKKVFIRDKNLLLVMAGVNNYPNGLLQKIIEKMNIKTNVIIFDNWIPLKDVKLFFYSADAIVLPYKESYTSGVLKLAYAFRKPIITTGIGELTDIIINEKTGILVGETFSQQDIDLIIKTLNSPELIEYYKHNIDKVSESKYSWNIIAKETVNIYSQHFIN